MEEKLIIEDLSELLLLDRLLDKWKDCARRADNDFHTGYKLHDRMRKVLHVKLKKE